MMISGVPGPPPRTLARRPLAGVDPGCSEARTPGSPLQDRETDERGCPDGTPGADPSPPNSIQRLVATWYQQVARASGCWGDDARAGTVLVELGPSVDGAPRYRTRRCSRYSTAARIWPASHVVQSSLSGSRGTPVARPTATSLTTRCYEPWCSHRARNRCVTATEGSSLTHEHRRPESGVASRRRMWLMWRAANSPGLRDDDQPRRLERPESLPRARRPRLNGIAQVTRSTRPRGPATAPCRP